MGFFISYLRQYKKVDNVELNSYYENLPPLKKQHHIVAQIEKLFEQLR